MNSRLLKQALAMFLFVAADCASAQTTPADIIDSQKPPAGFVAPKPAEARDLSMAKYARESFLEGEEGVVGLRVLVRKDGTVGDAQVAQTSGFSRLDKAATDVVKDWHYEPATLNGGPIDAWLPVNIAWALETLRFDLPSNTDLSKYWPEDSLRRHEKGEVTARVFVTPDGRVAKAVIDRPRGYRRLDEATLRMLKDWHFAAAPALPLGQWLRAIFVWASSPGEKLEAGPCGLPPNSGLPRPDLIISTCAEFIKNINLTPYQIGFSHASSGTSHLRKKDFDRAIQEFDAGIRVSPSFAALYVGRARAYLGKGENDRALSDFSSAIQVEPQNFALYFERAQIYFGTGERDRAMADAAKGIEVATQREKAGAYNERCYMWAKVGEAQMALADCNQSLSLKPRDASTLDSRGFAYLKLGQFQKASRITTQRFG